MRAPGPNGRHSLSPLIDPWPRHGVLVLLSAVVLSVLLVAVVLGWQPPFQHGSGLAQPVPVDTTQPPELVPSSFPVESLTPPATPPPTGPSVGATPSGPVAPPAPAPVPTTRAPLPAPPVRFLAVSGVSCPQSASAGYYDQGWFKDWYAVSAGGWTGDGCGGRVVSVPMSGDVNKDDLSNVVVWWFRVPAGATCAVTVFVPGTGNVLDADGAPATYLAYPTTDASGSQIGQLTVDQTHNQGRWVDAGSVRTPGDRLSIRMMTRGIDFGPGRAGAHLGVSALRVRC